MPTIAPQAVARPYVPTYKVDLSAPEPTNHEATEANRKKKKKKSKCELMPSMVAFQWNWNLTQL